MRNKVENIISQGLNCFVNRQLIYNFPEEIFADAGVMAIEHADFDGIERLALVTGQLYVPCPGFTAPALPLCVFSDLIISRHFYAWCLPVCWHSVFMSASQMSCFANQDFICC